MKNPGPFWGLASLLLLLALMLVSRVPTGGDEPRESHPHDMTTAEPTAEIDDRSPAMPVARADDTPGSEIVEPKGDVEERREDPIRVEVVDAEGTPRGGLRVKLELVRRDTPSSSTSVGDATTDAAGIAVFDHARRDLAERLEKAARFGIRPQPEFTVEAIDAELPRARFEEISDIPDPVRLTVGVTGSILADVRDFEGHPLQAGSLGISYRPAGSDRSFTSTRRYVDVVDGTARYDGIGLGLELVAAAWPASDGPAGTAKLTGPEYAGHEVRVSLQTGAPWPALVARLVDPTGTPLADKTVDTTLRLMRRAPRSPSASTDRPSHSKVRTDAQGRFRFVLRGSPPDGAHRLLLLFPRDTQTFASITLDDATLRGTPLPGSTVDIGDVLVTEIPILASGRVVDADGNPLRGAVVDASGILPGQSRSEKLSIDDRSTDADGRFTLRYAAPPEFIDLYVNERSQRFATLTNIAAGATGLEIVARELTPPPDSGIVEGSVVADEGLPYDHLEVALALHGGSRHKTQWAGRFRFEPVPAGTHAIVVRTRPARIEVRRIDDVVVTPGAVTADSRLASIDVRGETRYLRLRLVHPDGSPIADTRFWIEDANRTRPGRGSAVTDSNGRYVVLVPSACAAFELRTNDYATATVLFADDEREIVIAKKD